MPEPNRTPGNIFEVSGAIAITITYMGSYIGGMKNYVPGGAPEKFQVGVLGLLLLTAIYSLLYLSDIRTKIIVDKYE